jgi:hypothetical protein
MAVSPITESIADLRDQALKAMFATAEGKALLASARGVEFKALDEALAKLGGNAILSRNPQSSTEKSSIQRVGLGTASKRMSQTDFAARALRKAGEPLPIGRLLEKTMEEGGVVGGADPVANFRSNMSRDPRFESIMRNNMYFWWFTNEAFPVGWANEAAANDLLSTAAASSRNSNQEGSDGDATTLNPS